MIALNYECKGISKISFLKKIPYFSLRPLLATLPLSLDNDSSRPLQHSMVDGAAS